MGPSDDEVPYRPSWKLPDALDEIVELLQPTAELTILINWETPSFAARDAFWRYITGPGFGGAASNEPPWSQNICCIPTTAQTSQRRAHGLDGSQAGGRLDAMP